jgi:hypothetical protein
MEVSQSDSPFAKALMGHAKLNKRANESNATAFARIFADPENIELRKAHAITKSFPNMMSTEVVSTEVGSTETSDDSWKAAGQLQALVEKQRKLAPTLTTSKLYEMVSADSANKSLVDRAHRRPNVSSPSGDALQR